MPHKLSFTRYEVDDNTYDKWDILILTACHELGGEMSYAKFLAFFGYELSKDTYYWDKRVSHSDTLSTNMLAFSGHLGRAIFSKLIPENLIEYECDVNGARIKLTDAGRCYLVTGKMTESA